MSHESTPPLTDDDVARYREDGAICIRQAFSPEWIARLGAAVDADMRTPGPMVRINTPEGQPGLFFVDFQLWQRHDACRDFVFDSPAADIAARLMGAREVIYYHDHLLVKEPGTAERTPWHHDQPYYPIDGEQIVSLWLPLDPVSRDTCVEYVRGSHRWGQWFAPKFFRQGGVNLQVQDARFEEVPNIDAERSRYTFLSWDMQPGDVIAFHALTLHGAPGNRSSSRRRRAWATRWCGEDTRYATRVGQISPPIEGHGLQPGDKLACPTFPRVRPRG
jgi:ectoine hydroxylase-related dioxygenase (phytanoyl-CoA dioxygenase family)